MTSVLELQRRFQKVKAAGRRAAMVPDGSGMAGQLFCTALSYLLIPPAGPIDGDDAEAIYSRADYAIASGDLNRAVNELERLSGVPAQISQYETFFEVFMTHEVTFSFGTQRLDTSS